MIVRLKKENFNALCKAIKPTLIRPILLNTYIIGEETYYVLHVKKNDLLGLLQATTTQNDYFKQLSITLKQIRP